ncbi:hypothetical protein NFI96_003586, partial [Prochilodus magdalenae]
AICSSVALTVSESDEISLLIFSIFSFITRLFCCSTSRSAANLCTEKQLVENQRTFQQRIQQTENKLQELKQAMENLKSSAQAAVEDSEKIFTELIQSIERRRSEVKELIRDQEKTELTEELEKILLQPRLQLFYSRGDGVEQISWCSCAQKGTTGPLPQNEQISGETKVKSLSARSVRLCVDSTMAEAVLKTQESFNCPICLDLLKDPVTIPCGHSYCLGCIKDCWNRDDQTRVYSCPQCRHTFTPRPILNKNTMLAELAEGLRKTRLQAAPPAGSGDVECDFCTGTKHRAVKSCLVCLASYCEAHIQTHYESAAFKKHKLVEASMNLQEKICSLHDKLLEIFCRTDQQFICYLCVMDEHSGHKTVSAAAERSEKQKQLVENQRTYQQRIQQMENTLQELKRNMETIRSSAQAAVEDSEKIFTELIQSIERRRSEVKGLIRAQEKTELSQAEELLKKLEQEIADLRRRDAELEELSHTEDPIHFLQSFQSHSAPPPSADLPRITISPQFSMEDLKTVVTGIKERVKSEIVRFSAVIEGLMPKTREDLLKYSYQLSLDPNTAHSRLALSERNRKVTVMRHSQAHPAHPERFDIVRQVLCRESLTGRCYWEVEFSRNDVEIAVSYKDISRKGGYNESGFGRNHQSWNLIRSGSSISFRHNNEQTELPVKSSSSRIGVYVDHSAGILSFYSVSDTMTLLHRVHTTFTQPLYPGFRCAGLPLSLSYKLWNVNIHRQINAD